MHYEIGTQKTPPGARWVSLGVAGTQRALTGSSPESVCWVLSGSAFAGLEPRDVLRVFSVPLWMLLGPSEHYLGQTWVDPRGSCGISTGRALVARPCLLNTRPCSSHG